MALCEDVVCRGQGDTFFFSDHFSSGIYWNDTAGLGQNSIFYNSFEGAQVTKQELMVTPGFLANPTADFWGNQVQFQNVNVFSNSDLMTISNLYLSGFIDTAGNVDPSLNGTYKLKANTTLTSGTLATAFAVWTNLANTDATIYLTNGDAGQGLYTSNFYSGYSAFVAQPDANIFNGTTTMPIAPGGNESFEVDDGTGLAAAGPYTIGTNSLYVMRPQFTVTNLTIMDGVTRMVSNNITYFLVNGAWTNAYSGTFTGNGSGLTNLQASSVMATLQTTPTNYTIMGYFPSGITVNGTNVMFLGVSTNGFAH
jgi:hypothetical protein